MTEEYSNNLLAYILGEGAKLVLPAGNGGFSFYDKNAKFHVVYNYQEAREALGYAS